MGKKKKQKKVFPYNTPTFRDGIVCTKIKPGTSEESKRNIRQQAKALAKKHSSVWEWDFINRRKKYL